MSIKTNQCNALFCSEVICFALVYSIGLQMESYMYDVDV